MLSRRKFLTITVIMAVLFFMFQFSNVIKDRWNEYGTNEYEKAQQEVKKEKTVVQNAEAQEYVVYIGETATNIGSVVTEWTGYTKRGMVSYTALSDYVPDKTNLPQAVLLDSAYLEFPKDTKLLMNLANQGIHMIFCSLPDASVVKQEVELEKLLGIIRVRAESIELKGVRLLEGFFLGGAMQYEALEKEDEKKQDLDLTIPWYFTRAGTKSYMIGLLEDEKIENEELPGIIWRSSYGDAKIFAVNGNYMEDSTGIGILTAFMSQLHEYEIYPIVNAQNMVVANYPILTAENEEVMQQYYSRSQKEVLRDIVWPGIAAVSERANQKLSCMIAPKLDYESGQQPNEEELVYYLKLMKEKHAEAGWSGSQASQISQTAKIAEDEVFFKQALQGYQLQSYYAKNQEFDKEVLQDEAFENIYTVVKDENEQNPIISYEPLEGVTYQSATADGFVHTYSDDIRVKSIQTALGYSNIVVDMQRLVYPSSKEDTWEKLYDELSSNLDTYWAAFEGFEPTVLSESDERIRCFLSLDYSHEKKGNTVVLDIENFKEKAWFILRVHGEEIGKIKGAEYEKIEEGAYLIEAKENRVEIELNSDVKLYYYE